VLIYEDDCPTRVERIADVHLTEVQRRHFQQRKLRVREGRVKHRWIENMELIMGDELGCACCSSKHHPLLIHGASDYLVSFLDGLRLV